MQNNACQRRNALYIYVYICLYMYNVYICIYVILDDMQVF